jgi:predicted MPP superfamily phosphohydrolase
MTFHDNIPDMHFGAGWILTFAAVFFLNGFLIVHWLLTGFKSHRLAKAFICADINIALAVPFFIYFVRFFGGASYEPYMIPLSYVAGFYLCFSIYAAGVFFVTDIFRGLRALYKKVRGRHSERKANGADKSPRVGGDTYDATVMKERGEADGVGGATAMKERGESDGVGGVTAIEKSGGADGATVKRRGLPALLKPRFSMGVAIVCIACALAAFYTPTRITTTEYDVELARRDSDLTGIRAVFISDTHTGPAVRERQLDQIVAMTNELKPDIVLLGGDIIDEGTSEELRQYVSECFSGFKSVYGAYYILGNHDDYRGDTEAVLSLFKDAGIHCLLDETVLISDEFYLIGRDDNPLRRRPFAELEAQVTENLPVIVLDHRPRTGETELSDAVDLQLSGHTHDGQIFPFHILDPLGLFSLNYGRYDRNEVQILVSSGAGEYAAPVRLGSPAEILLINIAFTGN